MCKWKKSAIGMMKKKLLLFSCMALLLCLLGAIQYRAIARTVRCANAAGYITPHDLSQAYQFILHKESAFPPLKTVLITIPQYANCLQIDRADLDEQNAGYAIFYPESTKDDMRIFVDFLYQSKKTVLTGYLLVGKLARANDFILEKTTDLHISCQEQNIHEGQAQLAYLASLTPKEIRELNYYITKEFYSYKDFITKKILAQQLQVIRTCVSAGSCHNAVVSYPKTNNLAIDSQSQCFY